MKKRVNDERNLYREFLEAVSKTLTNVILFPPLGGRKRIHDDHAPGINDASVSWMLRYAQHDIYTCLMH